MKWMERTYRVGDVVEKFVGPVGNNTKPRAGRKRGNTTERQFERNDKAAARKLARLINANFKPGDMFITLTYDTEHLCGRKEAEKQVRLFFDRVKRMLARDGRELFWILTTSDTDGGSGEPVRIHHHLILPRLAYEVVCEKWQAGTVDYQLLKHQKDYYRLAVYLLKQAKREPDAKNTAAAGTWCGRCRCGSGL